MTNSACPDQAEKSKVAFYGCASGGGGGELVVEGGCELIRRGGMPYGAMRARFVCPAPGPAAPGSDCRRVEIPLT